MQTLRVIAVLLEKAKVAADEFGPNTHTTSEPCTVSAADDFDDGGSLELVLSDELVIAIEIEGKNKQKKSRRRRKQTRLPFLVFELN